MELYSVLADESLIGYSCDIDEKYRMYYDCKHPDFIHTCPLLIFTNLTQK